MLAAAIEWQAQEFASRTGIDCEVQLEAEELALDDVRSTALFRILQEALTNVARHAEASRVDIRLNGTDDEVVLEVRDNGRGIADREIDGADSFGIIGMRARVRESGGAVSAARK